MVDYQPVLFKDVEWDCPDCDEGFLLAYQDSDKPEKSKRAVICIHCATVYSVELHDQGVDEEVVG